MKPPKKKRDNPESTAGKHPGEREHPAAAETTRDVTPSRADESEGRNLVPSTPITNQDEQDKIVNAGDQDAPAAER